MRGYLGIDVGSVSTNLAVLTEDGELIESLYIRTQGQPIKAIQSGIGQLKERLPKDIRIMGAATTGSARKLAGVIVGADVIKNEITAHAVAAMKVVPDVRTVLEIGGQDSKIIIIRDGVVVDFAMNSVCAAGTGSFLDHQAARLGIAIEDFGDLAAQATTPVRIAGRCSVFAESDMVHKQQMGHSVPDIIAGLCQALVRNYLNNVGKGKDIQPPVVFQGGVAANKGDQKPRLRKPSRRRSSCPRISVSWAQSALHYLHRSRSSRQRLRLSSGDLRSATSSTTPAVLNAPDAQTGVRLLRSNRT